MHRDKRTGDRCRTGSPVGLQHITVDLDRALAELAQVHHCAHGAPDQALDLLRAAGLLAARGLAVAPGIGGPREHAVLGREPALAFPLQEARHPVLDAGGAQHLGVAEGH